MDGLSHLIIIRENLKVFVARRGIEWQFRYFIELAIDMELNLV